MRLLWMTLRSTSAGPCHRHARGRLACCSASFLRREIEILRARAAGGSERGKPVGTSEERDRASDLLRRESECCCQNGSVLPRKEMSASNWVAIKGDTY
jgi:hypothetical protein